MKTEHYVLVSPSFLIMICQRCNSPFCACNTYKNSKCKCLTNKPCHVHGSDVKGY